MPLRKRLLVHTDVLRDPSLLASQSPLHRPVHNPPGLVPARPRQARNPGHVTLLQGVNQPALAPQGKLRAGACPGRRDLPHPMLRTFNPHQPSMQVRLAVARVQVPPHPLLRVIVKRRLLPTLRTLPYRSGNLFHPHIDPVPGQVQLHFPHPPGMAQSQKRIVQFGILHLGPTSCWLSRGYRTCLSRPRNSIGRYENGVIGNSLQCSSLTPIPRQPLHLGGTHSKAGRTPITRPAGSRPSGERDCF